MRCGTPYDYETVWFGHLGDYRCPACGHARPELAIAASQIEQRGLETVAFDLRTPLGTRRVELAVPGLYNVENALAAAGVALALGASLDDIADGLARFRPAFGRFQRIALADRSAVMLLIKNPAGANEALATLARGAGDDLHTMVALNDRIADGTDVSWIWDVDWELIAPALGHVVVAGSRAADIALRLKYAGVDGSRIAIEPDIARALDAHAATTSAPEAAPTSCRPTPRCSSCRGSSRTAVSSDPTGSAPREARPLPALPRAPLDLRRPRQRARAAPALRMARDRARRAPAALRRSSSTPPRSTSSCSAAARIATSC